jgi:hypothetical protein
MYHVWEVVRPPRPFGSQSIIKKVTLVHFILVPTLRDRLGVGMRMNNFAEGVNFQSKLWTLKSHRQVNCQLAAGSRRLAR